jgi:Flp pilus assembly pilin Flp
MRHHPIPQRAHRENERGAGLVEYALLLALIAVVVFSAVAFFGSNAGAGFKHSTDCIKVAYDGTLGDKCPDAGP